MDAAGGGEKMELGNGVVGRAVAGLAGEGGVAAELRDKGSAGRAGCAYSSATAARGR